MRHITFVNHSTVVSASQLAACVAALQVQVSRDFVPHWQISATLAIAVPGQHTGEVIYILDDSDQADALGYHEEDQLGNPVGFVFAKTTMADGGAWQTTASHELLEQLVDPEAFRAAIGTFQNKPAALALEVCDPVEGDTYLIAGQPMSNFIYFPWFGGNAPNNPRYDFMGKLKSPLTMTSGGYIAYTLDNANWLQVLGDKHTTSHGHYTRHHRRRTGRLRPKRKPVKSVNHE